MCAALLQAFTTSVRHQRTARGYAHVRATFSAALCVYDTALQTLVTSSLAGYMQAYDSSLPGTRQTQSQLYVST